MYCPPVLLFIYFYSVVLFSFLFCDFLFVFFKWLVSKALISQDGSNPYNKFSYLEDIYNTLKFVLSFSPLSIAAVHYIQ